MIEKKFIPLALFGILLGILAASCERRIDMNSDVEINADWQNNVLFFGHQSIGDNLLAGIREMTDGEIPIYEYDPSAASFDPGIHHKYIGRNGAPEEKIQDFRSTLLNMPDSGVPVVAMMKFCFLDITRETDIDSLFQSYSEAVDEIEESPLSPTIVHFTIPLTDRDPWLKATAKRLLGREPLGYADNLARERLNAMIREAYGETGRLFDIAALESTDPEGNRVGFSLRNGEYAYALWSGYTDDAAHLNAVGRKIIAREFISQMQELIEQ